MILDALRHANETLQAFITSEEMDNAARYLQAGRRFSGLGNAALETTWADAWQLYYDHRRQDRWVDYIDADAELALRGMARPEHMVSPQSQRRIVDRIRRERSDPDTRREQRKRYDDFVRRCTVWRN